MLLLTEGDVMKVLDMPSCMEVTEKAFAELSLGTAILPLRINIVTPDGSALYMPACLQGMCALGCKVVTSYVNNPTQHHLPTIMGKVLLQDPRTGDVTCIMDGKYLTAVYEPSNSVGAPDGCSHIPGGFSPCDYT